MLALAPSSWRVVFHLLCARSKANIRVRCSWHHIREARADCVVRCAGLLQEHLVGLESQPSSSNVNSTHWASQGLYQQHPNDPGHLTSDRSFLPLAQQLQHQQHLQHHGPGSGELLLQALSKPSHRHSRPSMPSVQEGELAEPSLLSPLDSGSLSARGLARNDSGLAGPSDWDPTYS